MAITVTETRARVWARRGMGAAVIPAVLLLVLVAVLLLRTEGSTVKVLVAVWLWTLPVLGIFAGLGWLAGRLAATLLSGPALATMASVSSAPADSTQMEGHPAERAASSGERGTA